MLTGAGLAVGNLVQRRRRLGARRPRLRWAGSRRTSRPTATGGGSGRWRPGGSPGSPPRRSSSRPPPCRGRACRPGAPPRPAASPRRTTPSRPWRRRPAPARRGPGSRRCRRSPGPRTRPRRRSPPGRRRPAWPWPGARLWRAILLMVPGGTSEVSHFGFGAWPPVSRSPSSVNGLEPGIGWVAPPGQRVKRSNSRSSNCSLGGIGASSPVAYGPPPPVQCGVGVARLAVVEQVRLRRGDARVVAVGVVEGRHLGELGEEAHQVGHVGPGELDHRLGGVEAGDRPRDRPARLALDLRQLAQRVGQIVRRPAAVDRQPQVAEDGDRPLGDRAQLAQERSQVLGGGLELVDQRRQVVEERADVDEGGVRLAKRRREGLERGVEGALLARDRAQELIGVRGQRREVVATLRDRPERPRALDQELAERPAVAIQLGEQASGPSTARARSTCTSSARPRCCWRRARRSPGSRSGAPCASAASRC